MVDDHSMMILLANCCLLLIGVYNSTQHQPRVVWLVERNWIWNCNQKDFSASTKRQSCFGHLLHWYVQFSLRRHVIHISSAVVLRSWEIAVTWAVRSNNDENAGVILGIDRSNNVWTRPKTTNDRVLHASTYSIQTRGDWKRSDKASSCDYCH